MQVDQFLRNAILELKDFDEAQLVPEMTIEALRLDSLDYVEIQVGIKKKYGVAVEPELFVNGTIKTLGDLTGYITSQMKQPAAA